MKSFLTSLLFLFGLTVSANSVAQGSLANLDAKNGFKGAVFGSHINRYQNLSPLATPLYTYQPLIDMFDKDLYSRLKAYATKPTNNKIGDLNITEITYYFFKDRLSRIDFEVSNKEGEELLQLYNSLYGRPRMYNSPYKTYVWKGNKVNLSMTYDNSHSDKLPFWFTRYISVPIVISRDNNVNKERARGL